MPTFEPLQNMNGVARAVMSSRALCLETAVSAPIGWCQAIRWVEEFGYSETYGSKVEDVSSIDRWLESSFRDETKIRWFWELCLAAGLYHYERYERTRRVYTLPETVRVPTVLRFEEIRAILPPPGPVATWAAELQLANQSEMRVGSRIPMCSFFASGFAASSPRLLRFALRLHRVDERSSMRNFSPAPAEFRDWFSGIVSAADSGEVQHVE